jgi:D-aminopeptidase
VTKRGRLRDLGINIGLGIPGKLNAITDVEGVRVGHVTLNEGEGALVPGKGPIRTGVTAIVPYDGIPGSIGLSCGFFVLNGNGIFTGLDLIKEFGLLESPILLTNTLNVGTVYDAVVSWMLGLDKDMGIRGEDGLPVIGECDDSYLNDIRGRHVTSAHVSQSLQCASAGLVAEGAVGAGTGMTGFQFKGGIGTSSRVLPHNEGSFTVGVLVNTNCGKREQLRINGQHIGPKLTAEKTTHAAEGSICVVVATDAPLNPTQCERLAKRAALGLARTGCQANQSSGDFIICFSTTRGISKQTRRQKEMLINTLPEVVDACLDPLFEATAEAAEEAVLNSLFTAETMIGRDGNKAAGIPVDLVLNLLKSG